MLQLVLIFYTIVDSTFYICQPLLDAGKTNIKSSVISLFTIIFKDCAIIISGRDQCTAINSFKKSVCPAVINMEKLHSPFHIIKKVTQITTHMKDLESEIGKLKEEVQQQKEILKDTKQKEIQELQSTKSIVDTSYSEINDRIKDCEKTMNTAVNTIQESIQAI